MFVETHMISQFTAGETSVMDLTVQIQDVLDSGSIENGIVTVFVRESKCSITTVDFEPGLVNEDIKAGL